MKYIMPNDRHNNKTHPRANMAISNVTIPGRTGGRHGSPSPIGPRIWLQQQLS